MVASFTTTPLFRFVRYVHNFSFFNYVLNILFRLKLFHYDYAPGTLSLDDVCTMYLSNSLSIGESPMLSSMVSPMITLTVRPTVSLLTVFGDVVHRACCVSYCVTVPNTKLQHTYCLRITTDCELETQWRACSKTASW